MFLLNIRRPPNSPLFPYTTLFRSWPAYRPFPFRRTGAFLLDRLADRRPGRSDGLSSARPVSASRAVDRDRKSTRLNSSHMSISYAVFCLKKKKTNHQPPSFVIYSL